jgi:uncharacterized Fe-S cluster-containing MiaB family protein
MFVLFNENLNRYFKHKRTGVWYSHDRQEAELLLENIKKVVAESIPELINGLKVVEISELIDH